MWETFDYKPGGHKRTFSLRSHLIVQFARFNFESTDGYLGMRHSDQLFSIAALPPSTLFFQTAALASDKIYLSRYSDNPIERPRNLTAQE